MKLVTALVHVANAVSTELDNTQVSHVPSTPPPSPSPAYTTPTTHPASDRC